MFFRQIWHEIHHIRQSDETIIPSCIHYNILNKTNQLFFVCSLLTKWAGMERTVYDGWYLSVHVVCIRMAFRCQYVCVGDGEDENINASKSKGRHKSEKRQHGRDVASAMVVVFVSALMCPLRAANEKVYIYVVRVWLKFKIKRT